MVCDAARLDGRGKSAAVVKHQGSMAGRDFTMVVPSMAGSA